MQSHGQSEPKMLYRDLRSDKEMPRGKPERRIFYPGIDKSRDGGQRLRNERRRRRTADARLEHHDEQAVERDVDEARRDQYHERHERIAYRAERRCKLIVERGQKHTAEQHRDVFERIRKVFGISVHRDEKRLRREHGDDGKQGYNRRGKHDARREGTAHAVVVARAAPLARNHRKALRKPRHEPEDQKADRARRADARERRTAERLPDDDGIDHRIQLLKKIADQKRQHENEYTP